MTAPIVLVRRLGIALVLQVIWLVLAAIVAISGALAWSGSSWALSTTGGDWRGLFPTKNTFGPICALLIVMAVYATPIRRFPAALRYAVIAIAAICLLNADSVGSQMALIVALMFGLYRSISGRLRPRMLAVPLTLFIMVGVVAFAFAMPTIIGWFGRDLTFTGRTRLWDAVLPLTLNPLGLGFGGSADVEVHARISQAIGFVYGAIDNAYLVLAVELGWLATAIYVSFLARMALLPVGRGAQVGISLMPAVAVFVACLAFVEKMGGPFSYVPFMLLMTILAGVRFGASVGAEPVMARPRASLPVTNTVAAPVALSIPRVIRRAAE